MTEEHLQLQEARAQKLAWKKWGPYLSERQWGTVREDVKEYYFYLDSTPIHSYMKYLYKYPQAAYPYTDLVAANRQRSRHELEYELLDTGIFDEDRYFDIVVEYTKVAPDDILIQISVVNRGPDTAALHVLPTLWFRNTWSWYEDAPKPQLRKVGGDVCAIGASHAALGEYALSCASVDGRGGARPVLLFTDNETNAERIFGIPNRSPYVKDGIDSYVVHGKREAVNPAQVGTKAAAHYQINVDAGETAVIQLRLRNVEQAEANLEAGAGMNADSFALFDTQFAIRRAEADQFYHAITPDVDADVRNVLRQALAGMLQAVASSPSSTSPSCGAFWRACSTRMSFSACTAFARSCATTSIIRMPSR